MEEQKPQNTTEQKPSFSDQMRMGSINLSHIPELEQPASKTTPLTQAGIVEQISAYFSVGQDAPVTTDRLRELAAKVGIVRRKDWIYFGIGVSAIVIALSTYLLWPSNRTKDLESLKHYKVEIPPSSVEKNYPPPR